MNSPIRPDPHPIDVLAKSNVTVQQFRKATSVELPKYVHIPGKRRPVPTHLDKHIASAMQRTLDNVEFVCTTGQIPKDVTASNRDAEL